MKNGLVSFGGFSSIRYVPTSGVRRFIAAFFILQPVGIAGSHRSAKKSGDESPHSKGKPTIASRDLNLSTTQDYPLFGTAG